MKAWLVDTGPLVAYLDARDPAHAKVAARWDAFTGRLGTSSAVVTEAMHFVAASPKGPRQLAALVAASEMDVYDLTRPPELQEAAGLMEKYADTPMDFADATLVLLAEALALEDVFTLDHRGFSVYRTRNGRALRSVLETS
ncbi:MAG: type II toxin-antitoxin system VapC family toxin [Gemmatimonadota bacterium]